MPLTPKQIDAIVLYHIKPGAMVSQRKISAALNAGLTVLCDLRANGTKGLAVRDVRTVKGGIGCESIPQVQTIEGWREPLRVWTKEQPESRFCLEVQQRRAADRLFSK